MGWIGPNWCSLCKANIEIVSHLFISCSYAAQTFQIVKEKMKANNNWNKLILEDCVKYWLMDTSVKIYASLPSIFINNLWWA
jgi:hypothetical protein